eukprot:6213292-Pleurochrysis_carterae.AAC.3
MAYRNRSTVQEHTARKYTTCELNVSVSETYKVSDQYENVQSRRLKQVVQVQTLKGLSTKCTDVQEGTRVSSSELQPKICGKHLTVDYYSSRNRGLESLERRGACALSCSASRSVHSHDELGNER